MNFNQSAMNLQSFLWIHQSLSPPSLPWFINPHGISTARNMKSKLAIKFPTPYEWWSNALPLGGLSSSNSLPTEQEKASNARGMPGRGMLKLQFDWFSMYIKLKKIMQYVFCPSLCNVGKTKFILHEFAFNYFPTLKRGMRVLALILLAFWLWLHAFGISLCNLAMITSASFCML